MCMAIHQLYWYRLAPFLILQADPIDKNSPFYQAGQYAAYAFLLVFALAIIYVLYKRSLKK